MEISNLSFGNNVQIDPSSSLNNVSVGNNVRISKYCSVYGSKENILVIGNDSYVGMFTIINGYAAKIIIGSNVSIAQNVNMMADSGPNASPLMQQYFPIRKGTIVIEDHVWIGAGVIISPGITIGKCSVIAANSFVSENIPAYSLYGGNPAKLIRKLDIELP